MLFKSLFISYPAHCFCTNCYGTLQAEEEEYRAEHYAQEEERQRTLHERVLTSYNEQLRQQRQQQEEWQRRWAEEERRRAESLHRYRTRPLRTTAEEQRQQAWLSAARADGSPRVSELVLLHHVLVLCTDYYWEWVGSFNCNNTVGL